MSPLIPEDAGCRAQECFRAIDTAGVDGAAPTAVIVRVARGDASEMMQPGTQAAVLAVHVVHVDGAAGAFTAADLDGGMIDAVCPGEMTLGGVGYER